MKIIFRNSRSNDTYLPRYRISVTSQPTTGSSNSKVTVRKYTEYIRDEFKFQILKDGLGLKLFDQQSSRIAK